LGDRVLFQTYSLTGKASPNDSEIVIIVIIIEGEAKTGLHSDGIIAQKEIGSGILCLLHAVASFQSCEAWRPQNYI
jgi:hypothetical protein